MGDELDAGYIPALAGLAGALIGGFASFATAWLNQWAQLHSRRIESEKQLRESLFNQFIVESSRLYADALSHEKDDLTDLVQLYAMVARIRLVSTQPVVEAAEDTMRQIVETYLSPNKTLHELLALANSGQLDFMLDFSNACRSELSSIR